MKFIKKLWKTIMFKAGQEIKPHFSKNLEPALLKILRKHHICRGCTIYTSFVDATGISICVKNRDNGLPELEVFIPNGLFSPSALFEAKEMYPGARIKSQHCKQRLS